MSIMVRIVHNQSWTQREIGFKPHQLIFFESRDHLPSLLELLGSPINDLSRPHSSALSGDAGELFKACDLVARPTSRRPFMKLLRIIFYRSRNSFGDANTIYGRRSDPARKTRTFSSRIKVFKFRRIQGLFMAHNTHG